MILKKLFIVFICIHLSACLANNKTNKELSDNDQSQLDTNSTATEHDNINAFEKSLRIDLLYPYYPTAEDSPGGFIEDRSSTWQSLQNDDKYLVTQARYTWTAAKAAQFYAHDSSQASIYLNSAAKGFEFLTRMWGYDYNGFTGLALITDRDGSNGRIGNKKNLVVYGNAFALYATAAYFGASGEQAALDFSVKIYNFLDEYAYDSKSEGYFVTESNREKDTNVNLHVLEALITLYQVMPSSHQLSSEIESRISELLAHFHNDTIHCESNTHCFAYPVMNGDWTSTDNNISFGHDVELAFLMVEAMRALEQNPLESPYMKKIKNMVDFTFNQAGYKKNGGLYYEGAYNKGEINITKDRLSWWVQAESLNTLCMMKNLYPDEPFYADKLNLTWQFIENNIIDKNENGWVRKAEGWSTGKAFEWHANYHNARALMNCINWLSH